ncbi:MAG: N-acetyltransferase [Sphingobacteriales bacterium]|nr:MAG: N-acetyltransferase [Sphingobacteriales bacterium]
MPDIRKYEKVLNFLMKDGYSFSFLCEQDIPLHKAFVERNWPGAVTRGSFDYNKWKLGTRADGNINLLVCKKDGQIVGQISYIAQQLVIDGQTHDCYWGCNFMVDAAYKGAGIGAALEVYALKYFPIILGNAPTLDSLKYKEAIGFKTLVGPTIMMLPLKADYFLKLKLHGSNKNVLRLISTAVNPFMSVYWSVKFANAAVWKQTTIEEILPLIRTKQEYLDAPHVLHDNNFYAWRFNTPQQFKKKEVEILRSDKGSYFIYKRSAALVYLYEFHFTNQQQLRSALKYIWKTERDATTIKVFANSTGEQSFFKKAGFFSFRTKGLVTAYSEKGLFNNVERMHVDIIDGDGDI